MNIAISKKDGMNLENAKGYAEATGTALGGFIAAHVALTTLKQSDSLLANGGVLVAGIAGAMYFKNPLAKMACIGAALYGGTKAANLIVGEVVSDEAPVDPKTGKPAVDANGKPLKGVLGSIGDHIPEKVKAQIRKFLPTLGDANPLLGFDNLDEMGDIDLDDQVGDVEDVDYVDVTNHGTGNVNMLL